MSWGGRAEGGFTPCLWTWGDPMGLSRECGFFRDVFTNRGQICLPTRQPTWAPRRLSPPPGSQSQEQWKWLMGGISQKQNRRFCPHLSRVLWQESFLLLKVFSGMFYEPYHSWHSPSLLGCCMEQIVLCFGFWVICNQNFVISVVFLGS